MNRKVKLLCDYCEDRTHGTHISKSTGVKFATENQLPCKY